VNDRERRDRFLVDQMLTHVDVIAINVRKGRDVFETDRSTQYAVEHAIELFAEAAEKVGRGLKTANPRIPWDRLRELRRAVAHPYDAGTDPTHIEQTWRFARDDAPAIARNLRRATFSKESET
jgi:uncharacterized protein with HEPN domain